MKKGTYLGIELTKLVNYLNDKRLGYGMLRAGISQEVSQKEFLTRIDADIETYKQKITDLDNLKKMVLEAGEK